MDIETILTLIGVAAIPTALWLRERYKRVMADGTITIDEVIEEAQAISKKAEEVKEVVDEIITESESNAE